MFVIVFGSVVVSILVGAVVVSAPTSDPDTDSMVRDIERWRAVRRSLRR